MIELYELRQLQAFADTGTLSDAAESLHLFTACTEQKYEKTGRRVGNSDF